MKVVILALGFPVDPAKPAGGVEAAIHSQVEALRRYVNEVQIHVLVCPSARDEVLVPVPSRPYVVEFLPGSGVLHDLLPGSPASRRVERRLQAIHPDLVHVQGGPQFMDGRRHPSVLTIHGLTERDTMFRHSRNARLRGWLTRRLHRPHRVRYSDVIALSGYLRAQLEAECSGRFHFVPNCIAESFFELPRIATEPVALFVGAVTRLKNAHTLLHAIGQLKRGGIAGRVRIAGSLRDKVYVQELHRIMAEEDIADRVELLGPLPQIELQRELRAARCLVHPSFQENAPMAISEASAAGVPSVASAVGGIPEMVAHQFSGLLVDPSSPTSIAAALQALFDNQAKSDRMGAMARQRAEVHHPSRVAASLHSIYAEVIARKSN